MRWRLIKIDMTKQRLWIVVFLLIYLLVLIRNSWASDDAFITLRVADNILHGYGPRWNGAERVQVFTHPLWTLSLLPFYKLIQDPFLTLYVACAFFSLIAVFCLFAWFSPRLSTSMIITVLLLSSKSFMDYSSSGLENPLSHLLVILFAWIYLREAFSEKRILLLSFIACLSTFNRIDSLLLFLPALVLELWQLRAHFPKALGLMALGFLPMILWEIFSLLYYGFPFPNTYYAKLTTGIPQTDLYRQGWFYFINSFKWDHVTLPVISLAVLFSLFSRERKVISLALGILFYFTYLFRIGGDFMSGRFFSATFVLALVLLLQLSILKNIKLNYAASFGLTAVVLFLGLTSFMPHLFVRAADGGVPEEQGITDEKMAYYQCCSLLNQWPRENLLPVAVKAQMARSEKERIVVRTSVGIYGYYAGPDVYIMDKVCLGDPLRARLPVTWKWRIGHFERHYPVGYVETIENGFENQIREAHLHEYYDKLLIVTRGKLLSPERLKTIVEFNLGKYDYLIDEYMQSKDWEK